MRNLCSSLFDDNCATVLALATMGFGLVLSMICGGASARLGSRLGRCSSRGPMGLGSSYSALKFPSSHALMLAMILMFTPMASGVVCQTCKVHGLPVETPRLSPPPGWTVAADGRFMPPPGLPHATPQATVVAAWAVHRQLSRLASALVLDDAVRARTRHGA